MHKNALPICTAVALLLLPPVPSISKTFNMGLQESSRLEKAEVIFGPEPKIPAELQEHCLNSYCVAKFLIKPDGAPTVSLMTSSGSPEIDEIAMDTLRKWKFRPATLNGKPTTSSRRLRIEFKVE